MLKVKVQAHSLVHGCEILGAAFSYSRIQMKSYTFIGDVASDLIENVATVGHPSLSPYPIPKQSVIKSCKRPPDDLRFDSMDHFPVWDTKRQRCKFRDCFESFSFIKCSKCNVHLCLNKERNCFISFHMRSNNVTLVTADSDSVLKGKDSFEM